MYGKSVLDTIDYVSLMNSTKNISGNLILLLKCINLLIKYLLKITVVIGILKMALNIYTLSK